MKGKEEFNEKKNANLTRKDTNYTRNICERNPGLYFGQK